MKASGRYTKNSYTKINRFFDQPTTSIQDATFIRYNDTSTDLTYPSTKYSFLSNLGDGSSSTIFKGKNNDTGEIVIIKKIPKKEYWVKELQILKKMSDINSKRILKYVDFFENQKYSFIVTAYYPGFDLFQHIDLNTPYSERKGMAILVEMAKSIKICHDNKIIHLDIKCENYLVNGDVIFSESGELVGEIILIDFGHSEIYENDPVSKLKQGYSYGTSYYVCPEAYYYKMYSSKSDIWSLGVCMSMLLTGEFAYYGSKREYYQNCSDCNISLDKEISKGAYSLLENCLNPDPRLRPDIDTFIERAEKLL